MWLARHSRSVSRFAKWIDARGAETVVELWCDQLSSVSFADASDFTTEIVGREMQEPFPDATCGSLIEYARRQANRRLRDQEQELRKNGKLECGLCKGTGLVTIWHVLLVRAVREGCDVFKHPRTNESFYARKPDGTIKDETQVCACRCGLGEKFAVQKRQRFGGEEVKRFQRLGDSPHHVAVQYHEAKVDEQGREVRMSVEERLRSDVGEVVCASAAVSWDIQDDQDGGFV